MPPLPRLVLLVCLIITTAATGAPAAPFAYVTNSGGSSVSVVDIATNTVSGSPIPVRGTPGGVAVNAGATRVYVASWGAGLPSSNIVSVIDTASRSVVTEIALAASFPTGLALTPDGSRLFVTHNVPGGNTLTAIDTATNTVVSSIPAGRFNAGIVVHPDGTKLYVASANGVLVYDPRTLAPRGSITAGSRPYGLAINPAGTRLYIANYLESDVSVVDTAADAVIGGVFTGSGPFALSVSPDGTRLFVGNQNARTLSIIETASLTVLTETPLGGAAPYGVQAGPDGSTVYVADYFNSTLLVVDAAGGAITARITVGDFPIAFGQFIAIATTVRTILSPGGVSPSEVVLGSPAPVSLTAVLTRPGGGPIAGVMVQFLMAGAVVGSGVTGASGAATTSVNPSALGIGPIGVSARFAGGTTGGVVYGPSSAPVGTLRVVYRFSGFLPPIQAGTNHRGAGSMVPARWRLSNAAGAAIGDLGAVVGVSVGMMSCGGTPSAWSPAGGTLTYDSATSLYSFQWKTARTLAGKCARVAVALNDGTVHTADFSFR